MTWLLFIAGAYLAGSIPFGVLIGRVRGVDIRLHGSKNVGATNVGRVLGRPWGLLCFVLDVLKGAGPVLAAGAAMGLLGQPIIVVMPLELWLWLAVAAAAITGHLASIFLGFRGGKGVATSLGAIAAFWPHLTLPALSALVLWAIIVKLTKLVSLASVCAAIALPLLYAARMAVLMADERADLLHAHPPLVVTTVLGAVVVWRHRGNLARVRAGTEPRLGEKLERSE